MSEILSTLSDEGMSAALAKCAELSLDPSRGIVSLDESFRNLATARDLLMDSIQQGKLNQLPLSIQTAITANLESVSRAMTGLVGGADEVVNLTAAIEQLSAAVWQYGLHNLSGEVLGYQTKMNQLKHEEIALRRLREEIEAGLAMKGQIAGLVASAEGAAATIQERLARAEEDAGKIAEQGAHVAESDTKAAAALATVQQSDTTAAGLLAHTKTSSAEVLALEPRIKEFYGQIDEYRARVADITEKAGGTVKENAEKTLELVEGLRKLEDQIKLQIEKATGYTLFHSFQTRQLALGKAKWYWAVALTLVVMCSVGLGVFVIMTTKEHDLTFYIKLSLGLPLIFAISFCALQYGRERKLEEEYAFKSSISISLNPYQELVAKLVDHTKQAEQERFAAFIIDSVGKVFTSPTDKVFESGRDRGMVTDKSIKQTLRLFEPLLKALRDR